MAAREVELVRIEEVDGSWVTSGSSLILPSTHWLAARMFMFFSMFERQNGRNSWMTDL